ncbi:MAG: glucosaminidase domain-containing protein [Actinobacteria bacterium]|nr:glucosaminidase domain-containing protein [Actinomycetota bacterium]
MAATLAVVIVAAALGPSRPAAARDPITEARAQLDQARSAALEAAQQYDSTVAERQQTEAQIASLTETIPLLRAREAQLRVVVSERAAALYRNSDSGTTFQVSGEGDPTDGARRTELTEAATEYDVDTARQLRETTEQLAQAEVEMRFRKTQLDELLVRLEREQLDFDAKVATAEKALWRAEVVGAMRARGTTTIMGASALAPEDIAGWFRATGGRTTVAGISIEELAAIYVEEGAAAGVRGDVAFAQSIVETGSFNAIGPNNFAGLGACDSCSDMTHFPTPRDGVRAQVQHLRNYADPNSRSDGLGHPPSPFWYGPGDFDSFFAKGWCSTWEEMGAGNWATDPGYAPKVLAVYDRMLEYGT